MCSLGLSDYTLICVIKDSFLNKYDNSVVYISLMVRLKCMGMELGHSGLRRGIVFFPVQWE